METELRKNLKASIGSAEKIEFINIMDALFPNEDLNNASSKCRPKLETTWEMIKKKNWSIKIFRDVMDSFVRRHVKNYWMPADIFEIQRIYHNDGMVL
jgi:hypothetical protein